MNTTNETAETTNPTPEATKRKRGRPPANTESTTIKVNVSAITAKRIETLAAHDNKRIADLGIAATCDPGKMLDLMVEQAVNARFLEAFPKAFPKK